MNPINYNITRYLVLLSGILLLITISLSWLFPTISSVQASVLPEVYYSALKDAQQISSDKISNTLTAIVKDNHNIQWQGDRLKVATYAKPKYYEVGSTQTSSREVWVTVVPELQNFCTNYSRTGQEITPRIEQLLGLAPSQKSAKSIVELWVEAKDLFRPTPDPEITDHEAEIKFRPANEFLSVSAEYQDWFNSRLNEFETQFKEMNPERLPAPWTRLGYTYDWGDSSNHIGLSEFVLKEGANLEVDSIATVDDYCRSTDPLAMVQSAE